MLVTNNRIINAVNRAGRRLNSVEQRIVLGATALLSQPFFDYFNKNVNEDTRKVSTARTVAKIVAGTLVGVAVRILCIKGFRKFSNYDLKIVNGCVEKVLPKTNKDVFVPVFAKLKKGMTVDEFKNDYENYVKTGGVIGASLAMIATNFLLDAPLTNILTNKMTSCMKLSGESKEKDGEVLNAAA